MLVSAIKEFRIQHDEELRFVRAEWIAGRDLQHLRPALLQLRQLVKQLAVVTILLDIDAMSDLPVFDQIWLGTHWMPGVVQLPLKQVVIVLDSRRVYNQQAVEVLLQAFRLFIKFDVQFFTQPPSGMHYLLGDSPRLPELLAEWEERLGSPVSTAS